ncbi:MAG: hypothetical protein JRH11_20490 [Deltaproteobacteria bacterium]|nr:hypothetical protein [Deltaproteobacteria bacterium]
MRALPSTSSFRALSVVLSVVLSVILAFASACTRNVDDRKVYDRCFVDSECDSETTDGCFRLIGDSNSLGICSVHCTGECEGGTCGTGYLTIDGGPTDPICIQSCTLYSDCPNGGFACISGSCLPP